MWALQGIEELQGIEKKPPSTWRSRIVLRGVATAFRVTVQNGKDSFGLGYTELGARYKVADGSNFVSRYQARS